MTHFAVITTTIHVPTVLSSYEWAADDRVDFVVAGDLQTPEDACRALVEDELDGTYLGVTGDEVTRWRTHLAVGTRSIQRRNLALLHALTLGPDVVVTVDDDNLPTDPKTYLASFAAGLTRDATSVTSTSDDWYDPGHVLNPPVTHRGFPLSRRNVARHHYTGRPHVTMGGPNWPPRVGVVAGLWLGDPDVDAIERIVNAPTVHGLQPSKGLASTDYGVVLDHGTWAPFNTQNTAFAWELAPLMQCLVGVGRYDDIWMSYVARRVMDDLGWNVRYGLPFVIQARNPHDLLADLRAEYHGYLATDELITNLRRVNLTGATPLTRLADAYDALATFVNPRTRAANDAWLVDVEVAVAEGQCVRDRRSEGAA